MEDRGVVQDSSFGHPEHGLSQLVVHRIKELLGTPAEKESTLREIVNVAIWVAQELIINRIPAQRSLEPDKQAGGKKDATAQST